MSTWGQKRPLETDSLSNPAEFQTDPLPFFGDLIIRWKMDFRDGLKQRRQSRNSSPR